MSLLAIVNSRVALKKVAVSEYAGPCPKCGGSDRFRVWPYQGETGRYWCRQCDIKGDAIQFLRDMEGMSFKEACKHVGKEIAERRAVRPYAPAKKTYTPKPAALPPVVWRQKAERFISWAHDYLMQELAGGRLMEIARWLFARGITPLAIEKYRLGWNQETIQRPLAAWGLPEEKKEDGSLKKIWLPEGLVIPNIHDGNVQSIRIRRFVDTPPRYCIIRGSGSVVLTASREAEPLGWVIVENHLDAMMIEQEAGDIIGAMAMGSCSVKPGETAFNLLKKSRCILNALDYDLSSPVGKKRGCGSPGVNNPGGAAGRWWKETFGEICRRWPVPQGKDPGEAYQSGVNIREWLLAGLPPLFHV